MVYLGTRPASNFRRHPSPSFSHSNSLVSAPLLQLEAAFQAVDARQTEVYRRGILPATPTLLQHGPLRLLISCTPTPDSLPHYANTLKKHNVTHVVRVCEKTYDAQVLQNLGFMVHDLPFIDGEAPPKHVIEQWRVLLDHVFAIRHARKMAVKDWEREDPNGSTVAVHCVAGLGRAPVLAAIALVEMGVEVFEAVAWIRALRRGAINASQMAFLEAYWKNWTKEENAAKEERVNRSGFWNGLRRSRSKIRSPKHIGVRWNSPTRVCRQTDW